MHMDMDMHMRMQVGQAGDSRGTKALKDEDGAGARSALDAYRAEVEQAQQSSPPTGFVGTVVPTRSTRGAASSRPTPLAAAGVAAADQAADQAGVAAAPADEAEQAASTAREALGFFFSDDGEAFRGFLLDEVVNAADALSRSALVQLVASPVGGALDLLPMPGAVKQINRQLFESLAPPLTDKDEQVVTSIRKLIAFFAGDLDLEAEAAAQSDSTPGVASSGTGGARVSGTPDTAALQKARALLPVLQENRVEMQRFGAQIGIRLTELQTARAIGFVRDRVQG